MSALAALGVVADTVGILSFALDQIPSAEGPNVKFNFFIGSDGAIDPNDPEGEPLSGAGGAIPDIRIWEENGNFIDIQTNDGNKCTDGSVACEATMDNVEVQPVYTLLTANGDALCVAYATTTFPDDTSRYAVTVGAFAKLCSENYEGRGGAWYWSDVYVQPQEGDSFKTECAWLDSNGDQPTTAIGVHWPDFDGTDGIPEGTNVDYICNNDPVIEFHLEEDPSTISTWSRKRNMFSSSPSIKRATSPTNMTALNSQKMNEDKAQRVTAKNTHALVKSTYHAQTAETLCKSKTSAGPSYVSTADNQFCHMETKTLYPICGKETAAAEACFNDDNNTLQPLGDGFGRIDLPTLNFTHVSHRH